MRTCVLALATLALAQPAFAHGPSHKLQRHAAHNAHRHAAHHHGYRHARYFDRARTTRTTNPAGPAPQAFARTNATDVPFFSDPSFPNRSRPQTAWNEPPSNQNWNEGWSQQQTAQPSGFGESAQPRVRHARVHDGALDAMIARHAAANGLPVSLVHRVVTRESGYNPRASHAGNFGLMQIRYATARGVGYAGSPGGLLDAETNLTYAVRYLAGAYRAAGGNANRAVALYASGYRGRGLVQRAEWSWQGAPVSMHVGRRYRSWGS